MKRRSALAEDLKELAWAVFLLDLIAGLLAALCARYLGPRIAFSIGGAFALAITGSIVVIAAGNLALIAVLNGIDRRRAARERALHLDGST